MPPNQKPRVAPIPNVKEAYKLKAKALDFSCIDKLINPTETGKISPPPIPSIILEQKKVLKNLYQNI